VSKRADGGTRGAQLSASLDAARHQQLTVAYPVDSGIPRFSMSSDLTGRGRSPGWIPDGHGTLAFRTEGIS
jgi:hypothetical protein